MAPSSSPATRKRSGAPPTPAAGNDSLESYSEHLLQRVVDPQAHYVLPPELGAFHNRIARHFREERLVHTLGFSGIFLSGIPGSGKSMYPEFLTAIIGDRAELFRVNPVFLESAAELSRTLESLERGASKVRIVQIDEANILFSDHRRDRFAAALSQFMGDPRNRHVFIAATMNDDFDLIPSPLTRSERFVCLRMNPKPLDFVGRVISRRRVAPDEDPRSFVIPQYETPVPYFDLIHFAKAIDRSLSILMVTEKRYFDGSKREILDQVSDLCRRFFDSPQSDRQLGRCCMNQFMCALGFNPRRGRDAFLFRLASSTPADIAQRYKLMRPEMSDLRCARQAIAKILFLSLTECAGDASSDLPRQGRNQAR